MLYILQVAYFKLDMSMTTLCLMHCNMNLHHRSMQHSEISNSQQSNIQLNLAYNDVHVLPALY